MRNHWGRRAVAALMCAVVATSSVNMQAFAEALETAELTAAATAAAVEANDAIASTRLVSVVGEGARAYVAGVEVPATGAEVDPSADVEVTFAAKAGYALPEAVVLVTNVDDPVLTQLTLVDGVATIPAGTLTTDGTLNVICTLTGEPIEVEASDTEKNDEAATADEDLAVSLDELTSVEAAEGEGAGNVEGSEAAGDSEQLFDGAEALRNNLEMGNAAVVDQSVLATAAAAAGGVDIALVEVEANVENPAFEGYAYVDDAVVKVTAAEGVLPAGTVVHAARVSDERYAAAVGEALGQELDGYAAYDITLLDAQGNEVQPTEAVNVAIFNVLDEAQATEVDEAGVTPGVFYVSDDAASVEIITAREAGSEVASFDVEHFSIYVLGWQKSNSNGITGEGTKTSPYNVYANSMATFVCDEEHEHEFWTEPAKTNFLTTFDIIVQGDVMGQYSCVIKMNGNRYTGNPQPLYCGKNGDKSHVVYIHNAAPSGYYSMFVTQVRLDNVKMGITSHLRNMNGSNYYRETNPAPLFNDLQTEYRTHSFYGMYWYYYVGTASNHLIYYWDSYTISLTKTYYNSANAYDFTDLQNITNNGNTLSVSQVGFKEGQASLYNGLYSAEQYGYVAASYNWPAYAFGWYQNYMRVEAKAVEPTETVELEGSAVTSEEKLVPGDTVTFTATVKPQALDLVSDQNSTATTLLKTSTMTVATSVSSASGEAVTTGTSSEETTSQMSEYTQSMLYTTHDAGEEQTVTCAYKITRADCIAALKNADKYNLEVEPSVTVDYTATLKTLGDRLTTTVSNSHKLDKTTVTIDKEHYVIYNVTYENAPKDVDPTDYPEEIKTVTDYAPDLGGEGDRTPWWRGEVIEFSGYDVGQIVEDKTSSGYWVFSGWTYNGDTDENGNLIMGDEDINVTGTWSYVENQIAYEMPSWTYDGTWHSPTKSYAGTEALNVPTTPSTYKYYKQAAGDAAGTYSIELGSEHPTAAGNYKVEATWNYIVTNPELLKDSAAQAAENNGELEDLIVTLGDTTVTSKVVPKTVTATFTISQRAVTLTSESASKLYDGYALTAPEVAVDGQWAATDAAGIEVIAIGEQTLPNNASGEAACANVIVVLPALDESYDGDGNLLVETRDELVARAKAYYEANAGGNGDAQGGSDDAQGGSDDAQGDSGEENGEVDDATAAANAFAELLANYAITYNTGQLTVRHRTGDEKFQLTVEGATPEEPLTYTGKQQSVSGFTVNGYESAEDKDGVLSTIFSLDEKTVETPQPGAGEEGDNAESDASEEQITWTITGITAAGAATDVRTDGSSTYPVTITAGTVSILDAKGNDVTSEFNWTLADGSFEIAPIKMTLTAATVTRAYNTAELTAHEYTTEGGSFVKGQGFNEAKLDWGESAITRVGSVTNTFSYENAWLGNTKPTNYDITVVDGTLTVLDHADVSERLDVSITANSKQVEETYSTITLEGFSSMFENYATFEVETGTSKTTLYVSGVTATGEGKEPGKYVVEVTGTPVIWDSADPADQINVTDCFNLTCYNGYLTIRKYGTNAVEFSNRAQLTGKTYDGREIVPVAEGLKANTQVFYTTSAEVAEKGKSLPGATDDVGNTLVAGTGTAEDATNAGWSTAAQAFTDAGTYTVYAMGYLDGAFTPVESVEFTIAKRKVTLASDTVTKPYDGLELTSTTTPKPASTSLGWVAADAAALEITATGSIKRPGTVENTIVVVPAGTAEGKFDGDEAAQTAAYNEALKNYELTLEPGTLTVESLTGENRIALDIAGVTGLELVYNGSEQVVETFTVNGVASELDETTGKLTATITAATSDDDEAAEKSREAEGDAEGEEGDDTGAPTQAWHVSGVTAYGAATDVKVDPNAGSDTGDAGDTGDTSDSSETATPFDATYPVATSVNASEFLVIDEDGVNVTEQFSYTVANGSFEITKRPVTVASESYTKTYDLNDLMHRVYKITSGSFVSGQGINEPNIEWTGKINSPGSVANAFSLDNAWIAGTNLDNYELTVVFGTLTVNHITDDDAKLTATVKSKSDKQRLESGQESVTLSGFENEVTYNGNTFVEVEVTRNGVTKKFYVSGLKASITGTAQGSYTNTITGTALVYDSADTATRVSVTPSFKLTKRAGTLKLYGPKDDILLFSNEKALDGSYYDATEKTPEITSKYYAGSEGTVIYYSTAENPNWEEVKALVEAAEKNSGSQDGSAGDASTASSNWSTQVPTFTTAGEHTFYAVGVRNLTEADKATSDEADAEDSKYEVGGTKRLTDIETFTFEIRKRTVTLESSSATKVYDGTKIDVPQDVTLLAGSEDFMPSDAAQLEYSVTGEYIIPGTYSGTIEISLKSTVEGEAEAEGDAQTQAEQTDAQKLESILSNYQVVKQAGTLTIETRTGEDAYKLSVYVPDKEFEYTGSNQILGGLEVMDYQGAVQTLVTGGAEGRVTITAENGIKYQVYRKSGFKYTKKDAMELAIPYNTFDGAIYQLKEDGSVYSTTDVSANFNIETWGGTHTIKQATGNEYVSSAEWIAANEASAEASLVANAKTYYSELSAWSTWTYTGQAAAAIPNAYTLKGAATSCYYALDATAETLDTATWYTAAEVRELLKDVGEYRLSVKALTTNYEPCYAVDVVTVKITPRTITVNEENPIAIYDPTNSAYGFTYDERGNLYDASDNLVADSDGNLTAGAITGLPAGPAAIFTQEVIYTGQKQELKPVIVDELGNVLTEGVDYYLEYVGDTVNTGEVTIRVVSMPGGNYNLDFELTYEIVASENGSIKANDTYYYTYQGFGFEEPAIVANYGDDGVIYSMNGQDYEAWAEVVEAMINAGTYTVLLKSEGSNYKTTEATIVVTVLPLDMTPTPEKSVETVELDEADVEADSLYAAVGEYVYSGEAFEPEVLIVDKHGNTLLEGRDYALSVVAVEARSARAARSVDAAIDAGSYALEVAYRGNYSGTSYVAFSIDKVAGNGVENVDVSALDGATEGALGAPSVATTVEGSNFLYSVDGGAFVAWEQAKQLLTAGTHTLAVKATHTNYQDVVSDTFTVTIAARPAGDTGTSDAATSTVTGSTGSSASAGTGTGGSTGSSSSGSTSTGRTTAASSSTTGSNAAAASAGSEASTSEAVTVENTASSSASSSSSNANSTAEAAEAAVTHATYMYLTITIVTGMLLTAAYSLTVIKSRMDEASRLSA